MPLSEREQRLLQGIEQALIDEDPKFVASVRKARPRGHRGLLLISAAALLVGLTLALVGLIAGSGLGIGLGIGGVVLLVAGGLGLVLALRRRTRRRLRLVGGTAAGPGRATGSRHDSNGLRARMERRLHRRFDEGR